MLDEKLPKAPPFQGRKPSEAELESRHTRPLQQVAGITLPQELWLTLCAVLNNASRCEAPISIRRSADFAEHLFISFIADVDPQLIAIVESFVSGSYHGGESYSNRIGLLRVERSGELEFEKVSAEALIQGQIHSHYFQDIRDLIKGCMPYFTTGADEADLPLDDYLRYARRIMDVVRGREPLSNSFGSSFFYGVNKFA